ncbi:extensin-like [Sorghum bicolor]|uniref:extensin-like n=3 Tax=Sorghum bicolor TaxID=4558 RepID=UPI000B426546|nr:extensin-like [Sorghum bicolor]|eukprot:XP_021301420.1 extensin-like [Sorghum bicolor]
MANSAIDPTTTPTLREIRKSNSSSSSGIPIAPRQPSTTQMYTQMEARMEELEANQAAQDLAHKAQLAAVEAAHQAHLAALTEHHQRQMADLASFLRTQHQQDLPPSLFAPPPVPVPAPVQRPAPSAGSNPTPSPPLGASPTQQGWPGYPTYPTYPTQPFTWGPPPPQSQGYSSWPGAQTQQGPSAGLWRYDAAPSGWTQAPPQAGWGSWGDGTPGDGATS